MVDVAAVVSAVAAFFSALAAVASAVTAGLTYWLSKQSAARAAIQQKAQAMLQLELQYNQVDSLRRLKGMCANGWTPEKLGFRWLQYTKQREGTALANLQGVLAAHPGWELGVFNELTDHDCSAAVEQSKVLWNNFKTQDEDHLLPDTIFTQHGNTWSIRAQSCLKLIEPLDVANWYISNNHVTAPGAYSTPPAPGGQPYRPNRYPYLERKITALGYNLPYNWPDLDAPYKAIFNLP